MNRFTILCLTLIFIQITSNRVARADDKYQNFKELSEHEKYGVDYKAEFQNRHAKLCVLAIHGGGIEPGSDEVARKIAAQDLSYYIFVAQKPKNNHDLHITSTHFDDPNAIAVAKSAESCISVHGFKEEVKDIVCVGGGNTDLSAQIAKDISKNEPKMTIEYPCERFGGSARNNITNLSSKLGVQLELSTALRNKFLESPNQLEHFVKTVRDSVDTKK